MNILITGCNGQLGSELKKILATGISQLGYIPSLFKSAEIHCADIGELDITDLTAVQVFARRARSDVIFNCAAYTSVDRCETDQDKAFRVNAIGARNLAICAQGIGAKLVHISTDYVFAGEGTIPYKEYDAPHPQNVYGASKLLGEQYVRDFCSRYFIIRTAWLYGNIGKNFVKTMLKTGREMNTLKIVNDQRGSPTNVSDLAYHVLKIAATNEYGLYHCVGNGECSWYEFACDIFKYAAIDVTVSPCTTAEYPVIAKRPAYSALDNMMLRCTVGDEMRSWRDALACFIRQYDEF